MAPSSADAVEVLGLGMGGFRHDLGLIKDDRWPSEEGAASGGDSNPGRTEELLKSDVINFVTIGISANEEAQSLFNVLGLGCRRR